MDVVYSVRDAKAIETGELKNGTRILLV